jgi:hypothetical protein
LTKRRRSISRYGSAESDWARGMRNGINTTHCSTGGMMLILISPLLSHH